MSAHDHGRSGAARGGAGGLRAAVVLRALLLAAAPLAAVPLSASLALPIVAGPALADDGGGGGGGNGGEGGGGGRGGDDHGGRGRGGDDDGREDAGARGDDRKPGATTGTGIVGAVERFLDVLKQRGSVVWSSERGGAVEVRYSDGWSERVSAAGYELRDPQKRAVVSRPERPSDRERLVAAIRASGEGAAKRP